MIWKLHRNFQIKWKKLGLFISYLCNYTNYKTIQGCHSFKGRKQVDGKLMLISYFAEISNIRFNSSSFVDYKYKNLINDKIYGSSGSY